MLCKISFGQVNYLTFYVRAFHSPMIKAFDELQTAELITDLVGTLHYINSDQRAGVDCETFSEHFSNL
jgi:hypothetical protein